MDDLDLLRAELKAKILQLSNAECHALMIMLVAKGILPKDQADTK